MALPVRTPATSRLHALRCGLLSPVLSEAHGNRLSRTSRLAQRHALRLSRHAPRTAQTTSTVTGTEQAPQSAQQPVAAAPAAAAQQQGAFPWTKCWYPVAAADSLDPKVPANIKLLGLSLVVWADTQGAWHCLEDKCAHRMAPLSEGRVEDGNIMCCYHGWRFNGEGACTKVPQIDDPKAHTKACNQPNSRVKAYPTKVAHGLLWVWPESGLQALLDSAAAPLRIAVPPDSEAGSWSTPYTWFVRDLPLRFDTAVENLMDISHAPHAHHGVPGMGNRDSPQKFIYARDSPIDKESGFHLAVKQDGKPFSFKVAFRPPSFIRHGGPTFSNEIIVVPTEPGWSRVFMNNLYLGNTVSKLPLPFRITSAIKTAFPVLDHLFYKHSIFDGDTFMLHKAERELLKVDNNWRQNFFMPAQDDLPIVTIRRWLQDFGGDVPTLGPLGDMPPAMTKEETIDRYYQHTRHCKHCQKALATVKTLTSLSLAAAAVSALVALSRVLAGQPLLQPAVLVGLAATAVFGAFASYLESFKKQFHYVEYVHAHKD